MAAGRYPVTRFLSFLIFPLAIGWGYGQLSNGWTYYSQGGQDRYVNERFFHDMKRGVFVDIGAYDGVHISNTFFFEEELDWTGLCVEPIPEIFERLKRNRTCDCVQGCVSDLKGERPFLRVRGYPEMLSGLVEKYDPAHLKRIYEDISRNGGDLEEILVPCYPFNELLDAHGIRRVNYLSIDTEGGEFDILASIDFDRFQIDVITVENNYSDPRYVPFLESRGFRLDSLQPPDMVFVNNSLK